MILCNKNKAFTFVVRAFLYQSYLLPIFSYLISKTARTHYLIQKSRAS